MIYMVVGIPLTEPLYEGIVDEILSRYDTEDELIRIESLDLDLGELEEDEFYEQFPR